jgi:L-arabinokinase
MLVAYVTSHGYGHVTRAVEVLRVLGTLEASLPRIVVTAAPPRLVRGVLGESVALREEECDVGLEQRGALVVDEAASLERWRAFMQSWDARVEREAAWLRGVGARLVLGDVPPLAFAAAARAGVPGVALANFSWDWVYRHMAARRTAFAEAAEWAAAAYRRATLLLRLPFAGDLSVFPRIEDVPLVARQPSVSRAEARRRLGLDSARTVLWSFGGHGWEAFDFSALAPLGGFRFLVTDEVRDAPPNVTAIDLRALSRLGLGYVDLVAAADVVATKLGYGIVSDALAARTAMVYTDRGDFPEYPILVREAERLLPAVYVSNAELLGGRIAAALETALSRPWPTPPALNGAEIAARRLLAMLS